MQIFMARIRVPTISHLGGVKVFYPPPKNCFTPGLDPYNALPRDTGAPRTVFDLRYGSRHRICIELN